MTWRYARDAAHLSAAEQAPITRHTSMLKLLGAAFIAGY